MYKRIAISGLASLGLAMGLAVSAQAADPGFYAGAGVGKAALKFDDVGFGLSFDTTDSAFKIFGGYMFNEYFGLDGAFFDAGEQTEDYGPFSVTADMSGLSISVLGNLPLGENFALFGKFGVTSLEGDVETRASGFSDSTEASEDDVSYGVGAALSFGTPFELRAEYEAVNIDGGDFNYWTVSGLYRF
jgi:OOP family OmpA-OmpF porin